MNFNELIESLGVSDEELKSFTEYALGPSWPKERWYINLWNTRHPDMPIEDGVYIPDAFRIMVKMWREDTE